MSRIYRLLFGLLILLPLAACDQQPSAATPTNAGIYRPPTQVVETPVLAAATLNPGELALPEETRPTPTAQCSNSLWFQDDLTIPDGSEFSPGEKLDKRWLVLNNGSCNWDENYSVRLIAGPNIGVAVQQALFPARSGSEAVIRMSFIAPSEPGAYRSAWQAYDPSGESFGDPFFVDFVVISEETPTP